MKTPTGFLVNWQIPGFCTQVSRCFQLLEIRELQQSQQWVCIVFFRTVFTALPSSFGELSYPTMGHKLK
jgi:hypothetical protein